MAVTEYIGPLVGPVFADPAEWTPTRSYEALTIVLHEGNSYTARQDVPIGVQITNENYWLETGNYNAQLEQYRRDVLRVMGIVSSKAFAFNNVKEMQASTYLEKGSICRTNGFYSINDGGSAWYIITDKGTPNGMDILQLKNNLVAILSITDSVMIEQFGCTSESSATENPAIIQRAIQFANDNNIKLYGAGNTYNINADMTFENANIDFGMSVISGVNNLLTFKQSDVTNLQCRNATIITSGSDFTLQNIHFLNWSGTALNLGPGTYTRNIRNIYYKQETNRNFKNNIALEINCTDTFIDGIFGTGMSTGIKYAGNNCNITNVQLWTSINNGNFEGSKWLDSNGSNLTISNSIVDSFESVIFCEAKFLYICLNNCSVIHNNAMFPEKTITLFNNNCNFVNGTLLVNLNGFAAANSKCYIGGWNLVKIQTINGNLSDKFIIRKEDITLPENVSIGDNDYVTINEGKLILQLNVSYNSIKPLTSLQIPIPLVGLKYFQKFNTNCPATVTLTPDTNNTQTGAVNCYINNNGIYVTPVNEAKGFFNFTLNAEFLNTVL